MRNIGKYKGIDCFECSDKEWQVVGKNFPEVIFVINGTMVKNGIIIGYYNGKTVEDKWDEKRYAEEMEIPEEAPKETEVKSDEKMEWSSYSRVVDEFFANLKEFESWKI